MGAPLFGKIKLRKEESLVMYPDISKLKKCTKSKTKNRVSRRFKKTIKFYRDNKI